MQPTIKMETTLPKQFFQVARNQPHKDFLVAKQGRKWQAIKYQETGQFIEFFAKGLLELGLRQGDRVAILSGNRPAWVVADLGAMAAGGVSVPIHTTLSPGKIQYILEDAGAKILFVTGQENIDKILTVRAKLAQLEQIIYLKSDFDEPGMLTFDQVLNLGQKSQKKLEWEQGGAKEIASVVYTSGTTGEPKGVILSHENFLNNVASAMEAVPIREADKFLSFLPLSHVLERTAGYYTPMCVGATIYYAESIKKLSDNLKEVKPTVLICVPRIFERVYEKIIDQARRGQKYKRKLFFAALKAQSEIHHARRENRPLSRWYKFKARILDRIVCQKVRLALGGHLRFAVSGGASLNKKIARFFEDLSVNIVEGYGLTETAPVVTVNRLNDYEFGTVGLPLSGVEIKISQEKEILVRGKNVMAGYWQKPEATKEVLSADGWFATGDLGFIDSRGFLTIIGRKKEIIVNSGGKNISPEPVENALQLSKYVYQAMIIGNNRKFVSALIVPDFEKLKEFAKEHKIRFNGLEELIKSPGVRHLFEQEINHQSHELADYEKVKKFSLIAEEFTQENDELTPTLKLRRGMIAHKHEKEIEAMYEGGGALLF